MGERVDCDLCLKLEGAGCHIDPKVETTDDRQSRLKETQLAGLVVGAALCNLVFTCRWHWLLVGRGHAVGSHWLGLADKEVAEEVVGTVLEVMVLGVRALEQYMPRR